MIHLESPYRNLKLIGKRLLNSTWLWPSVVTIHPTDLCNHKCDWCWYERSSKSVDIENLIKAVDIFVNNDVNEIVVSGGGEPLMHSRIDMLLDYLSTKVDIERRLYTNGSLIYKHPLVTNAFDYVRVSLDAGDPELYAKYHGTESSVYYEIFSMLEKIKGKNTQIKTGISMLVTDKNVHTCEQMYWDCVKYEVDYILFKPIIKGMFRLELPSLPQFPEDSLVGVEVDSGPLFQGGKINTLNIPYSIVSLNIMLGADCGLYPCYHLTTSNFEISSFIRKDWEKEIGGESHKRILNAYMNHPHPCRVHDAWAFWKSQQIID